MGQHTGHRKAAHNELFIRNTAHISRYIRRIIKLFDEGVQVVLLHGLTASIEKCVRIALQIMDQYCGISYKIKTSSQDIEDGKTRSGIHIELKKSLLI